MTIKLSVVSHLTFLFHLNMTCAVHLQQNIVFTVIFHIVCISYYKV